MACLLRGRSFGVLGQIFQGCQALFPSPRIFHERDFITVLPFVLSLDLAPHHLFVKHQIVKRARAWRLPPLLELIGSPEIACLTLGAVSHHVSNLHIRAVLQLCPLETKRLIQVSYNGISFPLTRFLGLMCPGRARSGATNSMCGLLEILNGDQVYKGLHISI